MRKTWICFANVLIISSLVVTTACTDRNQAGNSAQNAQGINGTGQSNQMNQMNPMNASNGNRSMQQMAGNGGQLIGDGSATIPFVSLNGKNYVSARQLADTLEFQSEWDPSSNKYLIGDNDVVFELTPNSNDAVKEEEAVRLQDAPIMQNGTLYVAVSSIPDLFEEEMNYRMDNNQLVLQPSSSPFTRQDMDTDKTDPADAGLANGELDFADDPDDPFQGDDELEPVGLMLDEEAAELPGLDSAEAVPVLKNINMNRLIRTARRYLGVKYKFGAGPYPRSRRFDCSTYTDYIFSKYGVNLPRTARAQARRGKSVSRKRLRKGDLLFFYVPGRFRSNRTIGHVGIYMGRGRMIHASPEPKNGVQISSINKAYWKRTFIRAKRVAY